MKKDSYFRQGTSMPAFVCLWLFAFNIHAFAPVSTTQGRTNMIGTTSAGFGPPNELSVAVVPSRHHHTKSTTSLYMAAGIGGGANLFDRFSRVMRGTLNKAVASVEDPEKIIVQAVSDMQVSFVHSFSRVCSRHVGIVSSYFHRLISSRPYLHQY